MQTPDNTSARLIVGTYTERLPHVDGGAAGILGADYDHGTISATTVLAEVRNPSWVTTARSGRALYAVVETVDFDGGPGGGVVAYARDLESGRLTELGSRSSAGVEPAHLAVDATGRFLLVANYRSGSVTVFALAADGSLGDMTDHVQHEGSSVHPVRQKGPHAHMICVDPITGDLLVPDLGLDAVLRYRLSPTGRLEERRTARIVTEPGDGPRHLAFHPNGRDLFLVNELSNTVVALRRSGDGNSAEFGVTDRCSTLPESFDGHSQAAAVRVSASGRHVFASNRGCDSVAMFRFDEPAGTLRLAYLEPTLGREPRDIRQTPDGRYLLVANQDSGTVVSFVIDEEEPSLRKDSVIDVPTPVCLEFA